MSRLSHNSLHIKDLRFIRGIYGADTRVQHELNEKTPLTFFEISQIWKYSHYPLNMMKVALIMGTIILLAACSGGEDTSASTTSNVSATPSVTATSSPAPPSISEVTISNTEYFVALSGLLTNYGYELKGNYDLFPQLQSTIQYQRLPDGFTWNDWVDEALQLYELNLGSADNFLGDVTELSVRTDDEQLRADTLEAFRRVRYFAAQSLYFLREEPVVAAVRTGEEEAVAEMFESLQKISYQYNLDMDRVGDWLESQTTERYTTLADIPIIDRPQVESLVHWVVRGDSMSSVAELYGITVDQLREQNLDVTDDELDLGHRLYISGGENFNDYDKYFHTWGVGDTIKSVAQKYQLEELIIYLFNPALIENREDIEYGQKIRIKIEPYSGTAGQPKIPTDVVVPVLAPIQLKALADYYRKIEQLVDKLVVKREAVDAGFPILICVLSDTDCTVPADYDTDAYLLDYVYLYGGYRTGFLEMREEVERLDPPEEYLWFHNETLAWLDNSARGLLRVQSIYRDSGASMRVRANPSDENAWDEFILLDTEWNEKWIAYPTAFDEWAILVLTHGEYLPPPAEPNW